MIVTEIKLNYHPNHFCNEDGRSIFIRTFGVHSVSTMNVALSDRPIRLHPLLPSLTKSRFLQATVLYESPPLVLFLASHPGVLPKYLQSLRHVFCGAATLGGLDAERFLKRAPPKTEIVQGTMQTLL